MTLDRYEYFGSADNKDYFFYSTGPNGRIKKMVAYKQINDDPIIYNLAFGDEDIVSGKLLDTTRSGNNDTDKVLVTVANTIIEFSTHFGNPGIYAIGSSASRTRLYQMNIARIYHEISTEYLVLGYINDLWEEFQTNVNYEAFLIKKK